MTNLEKLEIVDKLTDNISEEIGRLVSCGVFTFAEGMLLYQSICEKQKTWMKENFTEDEFMEFMKRKYNYGG